MINKNGSFEIQEAFEMLKNFLLNNFPDAKKASGGTEVVTRCHFCGDSRDRSSRHLYIGINKYDQIAYHCFKCNAGGLVDAKFFRDMNIFDVDLINTVVQANIKQIQGIYSGGSLNRRIMSFSSPRLMCSGDDRTLKKLKYINNRLGSHMDLFDFKEFKIVPNILEYLEDNRVTTVSRHPDIMKELDFGFLGFLSADNTHIVMRRLVPEDKVHPNIRGRYVNYNIFPSYSKGVGYYVIPGQIDKLRPCRIVIAEGVFDILSVYLNCGLNTHNTVYAAACGKTGYIPLMNYLFLTVGIPYYGVEIHIYSDNDVTEYDIANIRNYLTRIGITNNRYIHFNSYPGEKDFGVPGNRICDTSQPL